MATPAFCSPATNAVFFKAVERLQGFRKVDETLQSLLVVDAPFVAWKMFNIKKLAKQYKDVPEVKDDVEKLLVKIEKQRKKEENQRMHENRRLRAMEQKDTSLGSAPKTVSVELKEPKLALEAHHDVTQTPATIGHASKNLRTVIPTSQNVTVAKKSTPASSASEMPTTVIQSSQKTTVTKKPPTVIPTIQKTTVLLKQFKSSTKNEATPTMTPKICINTAPKPQCTLAAPSVRIPKRRRPSDHQGTVQYPQNNSNPQEDQKTSDGQKTTHDAQKYSNAQIFPQPLFQSAAQRLSQLDAFEAKKFQMRMEAELRRANGEKEQPMCKKMKLGV